MRKLPWLWLLVGAIAACQTRHPIIIEGELLVKRKDLTQALLDLPDSTLKAIERKVSTVKMASLPASQQRLFHWYKYLAENQLLHKSYVRLMLDDGEDALLFMDSTSYQPLEVLSRENQTIRIKAQVRALPYGNQRVYDLLQLHSLQKVEVTASPVK